MKLLTMMLFAVGTAACTVNPPEATQSSPPVVDVGRFHLEPASPAASSSPATADETSDSEAVSSLTAADPSGDAITPRVNCSIVQFCNAPGSDGTRCLQQGCTFDQAAVECINETSTVCGSASCPWIFVASDGERFTITPCP